MAHGAVAQRVEAREDGDGQNQDKHQRLPAQGENTPQRAAERVGVLAELRVLRGAESHEVKPCLSLKIGEWAEL
jgi:hypothetical protein